MTRPLSHTDIRTIAEYLAATDRDLDTSLSELGFDPALYSERSLRQWLYNETDLRQDRDGFWNTHD